MSEKEVSFDTLVKLVDVSRNKRSCQVVAKKVCGLTYDLSGALYDLVRSQRLALAEKLWEDHKRTLAEFEERMEEEEEEEQRIALEREEERRQVKTMRDNITAIRDELIEIRRLLQEN